MKKHRIMWPYRILTVLVLAISPWVMMNDGPLWLALISTIIGFVLILRTFKLEPEIVEADRESNQLLVWLLPALLALVLGGIFVGRINGFEWVHVWVVLPSVIAAVLWIAFIWPAILAIRADKKVIERNQREAG